MDNWFWPVQFSGPSENLQLENLLVQSQRNLANAIEQFRRWSSQLVAVSLPVQPNQTILEAYEPKINDKGNEEKFRMD